MVEIMAGERRRERNERNVARDTGEHFVVAVRGHRRHDRLAVDNRMKRDLVVASAAMLAFMAAVMVIAMALMGVFK